MAKRVLMAVSTALLAALIFIACSHDTSHPVSVATVDVVPNQGVIGNHEVGTLAASSFAADGSRLSETITWKSSAPSVIAVDESGNVQSKAVGSAAVSATAGGVTGTAQLQVRASGVPPVAMIMPVARDTLFVDQTHQLSARAQDLFGYPIVDRPLQWSTSQPTIATVSPTGAVTGRTLGAATISATLDGIRASAAIIVISAPVVTAVRMSLSLVNLTVGQTQQVTATAIDAAGATIAGKQVGWRSLNPGIALVDGSGLVRGVAAGTTTIVASVDGKDGSATVVVAAVPTVRSVQVTPASTTLDVRATAQLSVVARDAAGIVVAGRPVSWSSSNSSIAQVQSNGTVTAVAPGTAIVSATVDNIVGQATVIVRSSIFSQVGCGMSASIGLNAASGVNLLNTFGTVAEDNLFAQEVNVQRSFYAGAPATVYILDEGGFAQRNAYARPDHNILFGTYMYHYVIGTYGGLAIAGVLAHEWGHIVQVTNSWQYPNPTQELEADAFSGYYMALAKGWAWSQIQGYFANVYATGDYNFNSPQHHGTSNQRLAAAYLGVNTAVAAVNNRTALSYAQLHSIFISNIVGGILPYPGQGAGPTLDALGTAEVVARTVRALPLRAVATGKATPVDVGVKAADMPKLKEYWPR